MSQISFFQNSVELSTGATYLHIFFLSLNLVNQIKPFLSIVNIFILTPYNNKKYSAYAWNYLLVFFKQKI